MRNRVKRILRLIDRRLHLRWIGPCLLYYTSKILRLKSGADIMDIADIKKSRCKDTVFIMGSGYSINDISEEEWQCIADVGDVFSFNQFYKGRFVPIKYHACGEVGSNYGPILFNRKLKQRIKSYYAETFSNPYYKDTIYFLRYKIDVSPTPITTALWSLLCCKAFKNKQVCLYGINIYLDAVALPSGSIHDISHQAATLTDAVNISYILGYKEIVLVGIDLYDSRYFWLGENETREMELARGRSYSDAHITGDRMVAVMEAWNNYLTKRGVRIYIYNPCSLLNRVLPIYERGNKPSQPSGAKL